ncbi:diaminobutyrate--2-oxoglutarate transaminase [uncultured Nisaea sp.]|uniref:diaminobutyrate--2-oxoglutarate transaminase n=1 Tax=uncultured Nisaea sp. TaxID=538215 RepID=UPI0030EE925D|tara:strand:- start:148 stop:1422 length:1275 start_codon:yes stop_codon:yes gene_type:complete
MTNDLSVYENVESNVRSYCRSFPVSFTSASGAEITGADGKTYIDFLAGCSSLNYGHNDEDMKQALVDYITSDGITHGLDFHTEAKGALLEAFDRIILQPREMDYRLQFTGPTGANAVEAALKLARKVTGRDRIVAFTNGFHGVTLGALACTGNGYHRKGASRPLDGVDRMPYEGALGKDIDSLKVLEEMYRNPSSGFEAPAAFILETVQGEGGLNDSSAEWLQGVERLARELGALLIVDDIQAGCGRTGTFFSFEKMGIAPDIVTMAKSLSGMGLPFAMTLLRPELDIWSPAEHNGTFRGNNHAFVTARIALEKFWSDASFSQKVEAKAELLEGKLKEIAIKTGGKVKGRGMFRGVDVGSGELAEEICRECFENGLIIETSGAHGEVVKVLAPLTIEVGLFERGLDIMAEAAATVVKARLSAAA